VFPIAPATTGPQAIPRGMPVGAASGAAGNPFVASVRPAAEDNPFVAPRDSSSTVSPSSGSSAALRGVRQALAKTKPWVMLVAILGFLYCGLLMFGVFIMLAIAGGIGALIAIPYLLLAGVVGMLSYFLWRYGAEIGRFLQSGSPARLEGALRAQSAYWQIVGILAILGIALFVIGFVVVIGGAVR
jgi:hypothetical protein